MHSSPDPDFPLAGRLLALLMANPALNLTDRVYFYRGSTELGFQPIAHIVIMNVWQPGERDVTIGDEWKALVMHKDFDPNTYMLSSVLENKSFDMDVLRAIVTNRQLDPTITTEMGHTLMSSLICRALDDEEEGFSEDCTLVDDFLARPDVNPNIRVWHAVIPEDDDDEDPEPRTHPVILTTNKDFRTVGDDIRRMYMTKAILKHPRTDIRFVLFSQLKILKFQSFMQQRLSEDVGDTGGAHEADALAQDVRHAQCRVGRRRIEHLGEARSRS